MANHQQQFIGSKILITGASGFIGSHLRRTLVQLRADVHAVSRARHPKDEVHWWQANFADIGAVRNLLNHIRPEIIFHLSGHVTAAPNLEFVLSTFDSHVVSTVNLLTAATQIGCDRIVLTASLTEPQSNCANAIASSPYAAAKSASSAYGRMFHALYKTPVTIVRPFMTYGPMQDPQKIIPYVSLSLLRGQVPQIASGRWQADWIYIDDVVDGLLAAASVSDVEGCTLDLGSGVMIPVRDVVDCIVKLIGSRIKPSFGALPDRPAEEIRAADMTYAQEKIGWKPAISLDDGLARTVGWYREQRSASSSIVDQEKELR